jgi:hypothetical protein
LHALVELLRLSCYIAARPWLAKSIQSCMLESVMLPFGRSCGVVASSGVCQAAHQACGQTAKVFGGFRMRLAISDASRGDAQIGSGSWGLAGFRKLE